ncbi:MAG: UDP-N-acetylmuramoyl-L-alanyl-D-glutamate--2,6-diaminopimelate ligase [Candidatus Goldbacteria bacterium]|nr:UDP-N-acetylmuramoyl-L-alanyl-D-glutamate--2,6-diaminopimelate ligase [Candidatus Goldiibacteriota bacterium]
MKKIKLKEILEIIGKYKIINKNEDVRIKDVTDSSAEVKPGCLFVCIKGFSRDGHDFVNDAIKRGAAAILSSKEMQVPVKIPLIIVRDTKETLYRIIDYFYSESKRNVKIFGITGTKGKTTVSYMIGEIIKKAMGEDVSIIGTIAYKIGNKIYDSGNTTPSNLIIHRLIHETVEKKIKNVVMEVSSHALDQDRIKNVFFDVVVITNVTRDHFDYHGNYENYLNAKLKIVDHLKKGGVLVVNVDDESSGRFIKKAKNRKAKIITYGMDKKADIKVINSKISIKNMRARIMIKNRIYEINSNLIGEHNLHNIMASIGAVMDSIKVKKIIRALTEFKGVKGRMEVVYNKDFTVIVDYAHNTDSLKETLITLNKIKTGRIIVVFGAGGNRDKGKRPEMGAVAERFADVIFVTSDNPRFENPKNIINDVLSGMKGNVKVYAVENRKKAIYKAIKMADKNDIVLLAGKGHETYQEINGVKYPFRDDKTALQAIKDLK